MLRITCTHCRRVLTIDDAFAGGVCRCQHCGTIQTVPNAGDKPQGRQAAPAAKTLYRSQIRPIGEKSSSSSDTGSGSGLDQLAEIVSSSGLQRSAMRMSHPQPIPKKKSARIYILGFAIGFVVVTIILLLLQHRRKLQPPLTPAPSHILQAPA
jgi:hypothetical protein